MNKVYVFIQNKNILKNIIHDLYGSGIIRANVHYLGRKQKAIEAKSKEGLDNLKTSTDLVPSLKRGALIGCFLSFISLSCYFVFFQGLNIYIIIAIVWFSIIFGAWTSSLIGISVNNPVVEEIDHHIENGDYILAIYYKNHNEYKILNQVINNYSVSSILSSNDEVH
jgi:uncharacterized membrane protein